MNKKIGTAAPYGQVAAVYRLPIIKEIFYAF